MGALSPGDLLETQHVLYATVEANGAISISIGDAKAESTVDQRVPVFQSWGWVALCAPPAAGSGAETIVWKTSGADVAIAGRDVRGMKIAGNLTMGEACAYAPGSQARTVYKIGGGVTHMTTADNTETGETVYSATNPDGFVQLAPWGKATFDATGFHVTTHSGAQIHLGGMGAPAPLDAIGAYATLSAPIVHIEGTAVHLGTATGVAEPVVKATSLVAYLSGLEGAITALASAITPTGGGPAALAAFSATVATIQALKVSLVSLSVSAT